MSAHGVSPPPAAPSICETPDVARSLPLSKRSTLGAGVGLGVGGGAGACACAAVAMAATMTAKPAALHRIAVAVTVRRPIEVHYLDALTSPHCLPDRLYRASTHSLRDGHSLPAGPGRKWSAAAVGFGWLFLRR